MSETAPAKNANRSTTPSSTAFQTYIGQDWADRKDALPALREAAKYASARRHALSAKFPGERLIFEAGPMKVRSNDTHYLYRAQSDFAYLTGWGSDSQPEAALVMEPTAQGHEATLYFRGPAGRDSDEFYANADIGEFWVGRRPSLAQVASELGLEVRDLSELDHATGPGPKTRTTPGDAELAREVSEMRLVKDAYEVGQMQVAIEATSRGFSDIARVLPLIVGNPRGERIIEGAFASRARLEGNGVGYETIAAAGPHACILHWTDNDGTVNKGDLVLIDAGVELDSYYTADITRTLPASGTFTPVQRKVYDAVREAADAALAVIKPGITFHEVHDAAMEIIAAKVAEWGMLPVSAEESLKPENQHHRRYMVHGTSHHLGIDVHDCAAARREMYRDGIVAEGMIFTVEPGLYFQPDDLTVPKEFRGIGVRIEDDIVVTKDGAINLSAGIPRTADEVEAWLSGSTRPGATS
jgi:Xaa-Pro aminopeptidase